MLELLNISKVFDRKSVLTDVTVKVPGGTTHALIGSSGSGKTTLLRITLGLVKPDRGAIKINGQSLDSLDPAKWSERIGYVPQEGGLFPHLNARENVALLARLRGWSRDLIEKRTQELAALVDLEAAILNRFPHELSGGQRQRVAIMRAAFLDPPVMLLDEPMGALDPLIRRTLQQELKEIFVRLKKTVLIVTHDLGEAVYLAQDMTLLHEGHVVQAGTYENFLKTPSSAFVTQFINAHRELPEVRT